MLSRVAVEPHRVSHVLVGMESSGKTALVRSITGRSGQSARFRGTTLACERYPMEGHTLVDSPGILRSLDSETTKIALHALDDSDQVVLVLHAQHLDTQLSELLPLVGGKRGLVVLTHWDRARSFVEATSTLRGLWTNLGVPVVALDARDVSGADRDGLIRALDRPADFPFDAPRFPALRDESSGGVLAIPVLGPILALVLLFAPAWVAVTAANSLADKLYDPLHERLDPILGWFGDRHPWLDAIAAGEYGFVAMIPFLVLYALPTVLVFGLILSLLKTSGLVDRLTAALEGLLRPFGLSGRDLVRVVMGFGCNVPAVISTRACSGCSRSAAVHAISFGSACSYQLPATLAVFAAAGTPELAPIFLLWLGITTLAYVRFTTPSRFRRSLNRLMIPPRQPVQLPSLRSVWIEAWQTLRQFVRLALPVFVVVCCVAAVMRQTGLLDLLSSGAAPVMTLFGLPGAAATAVVLGSVRKDGLAIALLDADGAALKVPLDGRVQVLTAVYLAGVLLPCLVTLWTISREFTMGYALRLGGRQVVGAAVFSMILAWGGAVLS
ncbi:MAG: nucleoside recognition domain-containing protein [Desertimonas sp.]